MGKGGKSAVPVRIISHDEVSKHNTEKDSWMVIRGRVYDVSRWNEHPGGRVIFTHAGQDASAVFQSFHSGIAYSQLENFCIGECPEDDTVGFEAGHSKLVAEMVNRGLFKSR